MINDVWSTVKSSKKPVVLYGMGNGADKIIKVLESKGISVSGVFASDGFSSNKIFHGFNVTSYLTAKKNFGDMTVLVSFGSSRPEVLENIKRIAKEQELYAPDVPVCGDTLFDSEYFEKNKKDFEDIYDVFSDEVSRKTFADIVNCKLSGRIDPLFECEVTEDEPFDTFFKLTDEEVYLDLGAYRGDTVRDFLDRAEKYCGIIAVEPDAKTYGKLVNDLCNVEKSVCINACVSDKCGVKFLDACGSRGTKISDCGIPVKCVTVDHIIGSGSCTYIKADIEGEELKALKGAENTIKMLKPKLKIACYHRSEDLIEIPKAVLTIRPDYKVYMRHFPSVPAWDTFYYFI